MVEVPEFFRPQINTIYPYNNFVEFERWFFLNYDVPRETSRHYLPVFWCAYQVNNKYGKDKVAMRYLQEFVDQLPADLSYFTVSQYDDGVGVDWKGKDVLEFNMSKNGENKIGIPLLGQPHPYKFERKEKYLACFVGKITHPIRLTANGLKGNKDYYISYDNHKPQDFCRILSESKFCLCYRGYGINSFRIAESMQYGAIPVYISDEFIEPYGIDFENFGIKIKPDEIEFLDEILRGYKSISPIYQKNINQNYQDYMTYEGCKSKILQILNNQ